MANDPNISYHDDDATAHVVLSRVYPDIDTEKVDVDGEEVLRSVVRLRELTPRDSVALSKRKGNDAENEIWLISSLSGLKPETIEGIGMRDYKRLQRAVAGFAD